MSARSLLLVPAAVTVSGAVMALGPYREIAERLAPRPPLDEAPLESALELRQVLESLGSPGLALYRAHFAWDLAFLVANAVAMLVLLSFAAERLDASPRWRRVLVALPLLPALFDLAENVSVAQLLHGDEAWLAPAAIATHAKLVTFGVAALAVVLAWAALLVTRIRSRARR